MNSKHTHVDSKFGISIYHEGMDKLKQIQSTQLSNYTNSTYNFKDILQNVYSA